MFFCWQEYPIPKKVIYWGIGIIFVSAVFALMPLKLSFSTKTIPGTIVIVVLRCAAGCAALKSKALEAKSKWMVGITLIIYGVHQSLFPFLGSKQWYMLWAAIIVGTLEVLLCVSLLAAIFQKQENELLNARNQLEQKVNERTASLAIANRVLEDQKASLQKLALELTETEDRERRKLAQTLHDSIGHELVAAKLNLEILEDKSKLEEESLAQTISLIGQTIKEIRSLTSQLSPPILHELGIGPALEWLVSNSSQRLNINVDYTNEIGQENIKKELSTFLFRTAAELLVNVAKHSKSQNMHLLIGQKNDYLELTVSDDGVGFEPKLVLANGDSPDRMGLGLYSISERAKAINGKINIVSKMDNDHGTTVTVSVPI